MIEPRASWPLGKECITPWSYMPDPCFVLLFFKYMIHWKETVFMKSNTTNNDFIPIKNRKPIFPGWLTTHSLMWGKSNDVLDFFKQMSVNRFHLKY